MNPSFMARKTVEFDDALFQHKIRKLAKKWNIDEKQFVKEQGGLFLADIGRFVPPYKEFPSGRGRSLGAKKDEKAGQLAIEYDLNKIFFIPRRDIYNWAAKTFSSGNIYRGKRIIGAGVIKSMDEMRRFHNANRNPRSGRTRPLKGFQQMWVTESMFEKYLLIQQKDVGIAKASIAKGIFRLNKKIKIPAWIQKQMPKANGTARITKIGNAWTAISDAKAFGLQYVQAKTLSIIKRGRLKAMERRLKFLFKETAKQSGWNVR